MVYSISCTTREPRGDEEDDVDYHFMKVSDFERLISENAFLEHALVHGNYYGTLASPIRSAIRDNLSILLDIDVAGAAQVRESLSKLPADDPLHSCGLVDIFISPPSMEELERRLVSRGEDSPDVIARRIRNARGEIARRHEFRFGLVNDDLSIAYRELRAILEHEDAIIGPAKESR